MSLNTIAMFKLLGVCRVVREQAFHARNFIKIDHALFERFTAWLSKIDESKMVGAREAAELIARDFIAAKRTDADAQATLSDWIADAIQLEMAEIEMEASRLRFAAQCVIDHWEEGDLAGAVRALDATLHADGGQP